VSTAVRSKWQGEPYECRTKAFMFFPSAGVSMADRIPHLVAMFMEVAHDDPDPTLGWCDDQTEFEFGLDLILDGLDKTRKTP
jgi:hypothetical protein